MAKEIPQQEFKPGSEVEEPEQTSKAPDFKGKIDVAIWKNKTKDGRDYLTVNFGGLRVPCWENKPKGGEE